MLLDHDSQLNALFPFGLMLDRSGRIAAAGRTLLKLVPNLEQESAFEDHFEVLSPSLGLSGAGFHELTNEIIVIQAKRAPQGFRLRGQCLQSKTGYLLALTLVLTDLTKLPELGLDLSDFSLSDPIFDLLLLVQSERRHAEELRKASERERQAMTQLAMASRLSGLGEMSAGIAHEINNPLAIIQMACEQFLDSPEMPVERAVTIIRRAQNASMRISKIVSGLRTYARDGSLDDVSTVDLAQLVQDTLLLCENRFRQRGVDLTVAEIPQDFSMECNSVQISQVLMNLLCNALDSVENRERPWVRLDTQVSADDIRIRVTDCGPRLSRSVADRVMQPFFTTKPVGKGTGLGLPISLGIAEAHGGRLFLDCDSENVSFVLELPRRQKK